jgi:hypothetical protein
MILVIMKEDYNSINKNISNEDFDIKELSKDERIELRVVLSKYVRVNDDPSLG